MQLYRYGCRCRSRYRFMPRYICACARALSPSGMWAHGRSTLCVGRTYHTCAGRKSINGVNAAELTRLPSQHTARQRGIWLELGCLWPMPWTPDYGGGDDGGGRRVRKRENRENRGGAIERALACVRVRV